MLYSALVGPIWHDNAYLATLFVHIVQYFAQLSYIWALRRGIKHEMDLRDAVAWRSFSH